MTVLIVDEKQVLVQYDRHNIIWVDKDYFKAMGGVICGQ
jgi:hypothetical protein